MIVDSSALIALIHNEPQADDIFSMLIAASEVRMSAGSYLETSIKLDRAGDAVISRRLDDVLREFGVAIEPFDHAQAVVARRAYQDFGRGSGHPAKLNFGDTIAYALAAMRHDTLLYKGNDFAHTDVQTAIRLLDDSAPD
ncbi:MAG: type II toxin-antitoxin system VapC family toxin [Solirubrobacterales bacterium]